MRKLSVSAYGLAVCGLVVIGLQSSAEAQNAMQAHVVAACGTPDITLTAGKNGPVFQDTTGKLCTSGSGGGGGGTSSNFGSAFPTAGTAIGAKSSSGSLMSPLNLDSSGNLLVNVAAGGAGGGAVFGPTAVGSAAANPPVLIAGTANATAAGTVQVAKVDNTGQQFFDCGSSTNTLCGLINSPPPLLVNGSNGTWTGLTPGTAQTGTIVAANIDNTSWAGTKLGAPSNYGTSPGVVVVPGVNAFVTNTVATTLATAPALVASTANIGNVGGQINVTPTDCSGTIASGGTAQNAFSAQAALHGFTIVNLSTDPFWISFTTTAAVGATQSYLLAAGSTTVQGGSFSTPLGFGMNTALSVIAATTSDKYSCTRW